MAQVPTRTFSPPLSSPSPSALSAGGTFPNKRPRLSPNPTSPLGPSPGSPQPLHRPPSPGTKIVTNGASAVMAPGAGTMGPPSRPVEKATDTAELTDVVAQSGIDIKDEERHLMAYFSKDRNPPAPATAANALSFTSTVSDSSTLSAGNTQNDSLQQSQGQPGTTFGSVSLSHIPADQGPAEQVVQAEWSAALRRKAQAKSQHLNDPFLQGDPLRVRTTRKILSVAPRLLPRDSSEPHQKAPLPRVNAVNTTAPERRSSIGLPENFVAADSPLSDILALLSLASAERIRGLLEDAVALTKEQRVGSQGLVPVEWSDIAVSHGIETATSNAMETRNPNLNGPDSSSGNPRKRSHIVANLPTPISDDAQSAAASITFPNELAKTMRAYSVQQRNLEEERLSKRAKRTSNATTPADTGKASPAAPSTPGSGSIGGLIGERAPETGTKRLSKKEQAKLQNARNDEAHQHRSANSTARMMMGGGKSSLFKNKSYAWMTAGADASRMSTPTRSNAPGDAGVAADGTMAGPASEGGLTIGGGKRLGEWREDSGKGAGVQLRDWVRVLESDNIDKVSIARAYAGLG